MDVVQKSWARELLMPAPGDGERAPPTEVGDERLSVRQAIVVWLAAAAFGWLVTVAAVYLAARVF